MQQIRFESVSNKKPNGLEESKTRIERNRLDPKWDRTRPEKTRKQNRNGFGIVVPKPKKRQNRIEFSVFIFHLPFILFSIFMIVELHVDTASMNRLFIHNDLRLRNLFTATKLIDRLICHTIINSVPTLK